MDRQEAAMLVNPHIILVERYSAVRREVVNQLVGDEGYEKLMRDKIRNCGPSDDTIYSWNVVDAVVLYADHALLDRVSKIADELKQYWPQTTPNPDGAA